MTKIIFTNASQDYGVDAVLVPGNNDAVAVTEDNTVKVVEGKVIFQRVVLGQHTMVASLQSDRKPPRTYERLLELVPLK